MGVLFNRIIKVTFGPPGSFGKETTGLFTQFEVEKTSESGPNRAKITIANLNRDSLSILQEEGAIVRLEVGYDGVAEELFFGNITKSKTEQEAADAFTLIEASDGGKNLETATVNQSFGAGVTTKQVIELLARELNVSLGAIKGVTTEAFQNGITLSGSAKTQMDTITEKLGLEWSIQDRALQILPPEEPSDLFGTLLTPETGLLGSPAKRESGLEFVSLMNTKIKPGVAVLINSRDVDGTFKVRKCTYVGNSDSGPFQVQCEAKEIETQVVTTSDVLSVRPPTVENFA